MSLAARETLLAIRGLRTCFELESGVLRAVDGIDLTIRAGETVGLVGESGSGKTMTALSILGLVPPPGRIVAGEILFRGRDLVALSTRELRAIRGREIAMIFQEPASALNPVFTVGQQIAEVLRAHAGLARSAARERAIERLAEVGIPDPETRAHAYPHELSGGQRQRAMIAMAIACGPHLLLADEPTSALDVTVQDGILDLLATLQRRTGMALLLVTHDLALVAENAERVAVMYAGAIVESAEVGELFERPRHPYTIALLRSRPSAAGQRALPRSRPGPGELPGGCRYRARCPLARERCAEEPPLAALAPPAGSEHRVACHFPEEAAAL